MIKEIKNLQKLLEHLKILLETFGDKNSYKRVEEILRDINSEIDYITTLYKTGNGKVKLKERQLVLADIIEFIIFGRLAYSMQKQGVEGRKNFIKFLLYFINLLMEIDSLTVSAWKRRRFIFNIMKNKVYLSDIDKNSISNLYRQTNNVGLPEADREFNKIYDSLLPKTAGGLWHEIGVYAFMLRLDLGYIFPLLIHQRIFSLSDYLVVPDFLLLTYDKRFYGVEVGNKKEIQSGLFSAKTAIPTINIDTNSSRLSDRCPICKEWIQICPYAIKKFLDLEDNRLLQSKFEIKCLEECDIYKKEEILSGKCPYTKYNQGKGSGNNLYNTHLYADNKHYHYKCVIRTIKKQKRNDIINNIKERGQKAIKTHLPFYSGFEGLYKQ